jgi:uncharacterized membrane protein YqjE
MKIFEPNGLIDNLQKYVQTQIELAKIEVQAQVERRLRQALVLGAMLLLGGIAVLFLLIGLAQYLNYRWQSTYWGYWAVAGGCTLVVSVLGMLVYLQQKTQNQTAVRASDPE